MKQSLVQRAASLIHQFQNVEIWITSCIVHDFANANCTTLVNPANPDLCGVSQFSYFPRGGPVPTQMLVGSSWGGMEAGTNMLYPSQVVDGLVHRHVEDELSGLKCPVGEAVGTSGGDLNFDFVLHTASPFFSDSNSRELLAQCYQSVLSMALSDGRLAMPLMGAGARGFPIDVASQVAISEASKTRDKVIVFGVLDPQIAETLATTLRRVTGDT